MATKSDAAILLASILTHHDAKQSTRKGYNPYALGIYLSRVDEIARRIEQGLVIEDALEGILNDRLAQYVITQWHVRSKRYASLNRETTP